MDSLLSMAPSGMTRQQQLQMLVAKMTPRDPNEVREQATKDVQDPKKLETALRLKAALDETKENTQSPSILPQLEQATEITPALLSQIFPRNAMREMAKDTNMPAEQVDKACEAMIETVAKIFSQLMMPSKANSDPASDPIRPLGRAQTMGPDDEDDPYKVQFKPLNVENILASLDASSLGLDPNELASVPMQMAALSSLQTEATMMASARISDSKETLRRVENFHDAVKSFISVLKQLEALDEDSEEEEEEEDSEAEEEDSDDEKEDSEDEAEDDSEDEGEKQTPMEKLKKKLLVEFAVVQSQVSSFIFRLEETQKMLEPALVGFSKVTQAITLIARDADPVGISDLLRELTQPKEVTNAEKQTPRLDSEELETEIEDAVALFVSVVKAQAEKEAAADAEYDAAKKEAAATVDRLTGMFDVTSLDAEDVD